MKIEWNKVIYADCMNEENGLPTLPDKSIDLCITDPPYNCKFNGEKRGLRPGLRERKYEDNREDYPGWCLSWFNELKRVCKNNIFIHCGNMNLNMWIADIEKPYSIIYHYKEDVQSSDKSAYLCKLTPILIYRQPKNRFRINPIKIKNKYDLQRGSFIHPCPMNYNVIFEILKTQKPISVIDPFMGSGTTAFCANQLNIKFFGYEKEIIYKQDLNRRIKNKNILSFNRYIY